ncbi:MULTISPECIES: hypothetical protein [unclassified Streptomyces]|uniref:hypothetical protein n=1 Tax=unclassified Streptomyces TaxID=2593676 RepID=UPI002E119162|nr:MULTISPECIES: hypothetical protein [unclassified Streptomyces]WSR21445.1 hypothetical protein OG573_21470 [Streptomyces sp. NBC_01205]
MIRRRRERGRRSAAAVAVVAAAFLLSGCTGGDALSVDELREIADAVDPEGGIDCPLPYDFAEAAEAAGVTGDAGPGYATADLAAISGETDGGSDPNGPFARNPGGVVSCVFHIGREDLEVHTVATRRPRALSVLLPVVSKAAGVGPDGLIPFSEAAAAAEAGTPVLVTSGNVAAVRLELDGNGDASLLLTAGDAGHSGLSRGQVEGLARALAGQVPG